MTKVYEGYNAKTVPNEEQTSANAMRVFALKYHPMNDDIFVTGGWENHLKVKNYHFSHMRILISYIHLDFKTNTTLMS